MPITKDDLTLFVVALVFQSDQGTVLYQNATLAINREHAFGNVFESVWKQEPAESRLALRRVTDADKAREELLENLANYEKPAEEE